MASQLTQSKRRPRIRPDAVPDTEVCRTALYEKSLREFVRGAWHVVEPSTPFVPGWHIDAICDHLEAVTAGDIRNLLINIPPRHAKSLCVSVFWMTWSWINHPETRWIYASYVASLSIRDSLKCRRIIESVWFRTRWGSRFAMTSDQNAKVLFQNNKTGYRIATSVGGGTGEGATVVVCDDPHSVAEKESEAKIERAIAWWDEVMSTRLNDPKTGCKVIVMQRVAENDMSGHVLKQAGYEHLCLPAEYEPSRKCVTLLGWEDPRQKEGELLWPARIGPAEIADFKVRLGPMGYAGQFQQRPAPAGGGRFKQEWFRYFRESGGIYALIDPMTGGVLKSFKKSECDHFPVLDPASAEKTVNTKPCYSAMPTIAVTPDGDMLVVSMYRDQAAAPDLADAVVKIVHAQDLPWVGIESNGIGLPLIQNLRRRHIAIHAIPARGSKLARSETAEIRMAAGTVYFRQGAPWLFDFEKELLTFPAGEYCDQVDAFSHAAREVERRRGALATAGEREHGAARQAKADEDELAAASPGTGADAVTEDIEDIDAWLNRK